MSNSIQAEVDSLGNILAHYQASVTIPITDTDDQGNVINIGAANWTFAVKGFEKPIAADPDQPTRKLLVLTAAEIREHVPNGGTGFVVLDKTVPSLPEIRWEGRIIPRGWQ